MGKFIDNPNERSLVNNYVDAYLDATNRYSKFIDSAPSFVTYYRRNYTKSIENVGLGNTTEVVGKLSGNRYERINNFPIYQVEVITPDMLDDGISGVSTEADTVATILPDTVKPLTDDLLAFSYHEKEEDHNFRLYRVIEVDISTIDSNTYYRVSLQAVSYDIEELDRQVVNDYQLIYDNIGTSEKVVLLESDYIEAGKIERVLTHLSKVYVKNFFDERIGCFLYKDKQQQRVYTYSNDVHKFLKNNRELLISSKTFMKNIMVEEYDSVDEYCGLHYKYIEDKVVYEQDPQEDEYDIANFIYYNMSTNRNSTFNMFPETFITYQGHQFEDRMELLVFLNVVNIFDRSLNVPSFIDIKAEANKVIREIAIEQGIDHDEVIELHYLANIDVKQTFNERLLDEITKKYTYNPSSNWLLSSIPSQNQLVGLINQVLSQPFDEVNIGEVMEVIKINSKLFSSNELLNYLYLPILLYILSKFLHTLVNK